MFSAPTSVQHLEDRIQTNVSLFKVIGHSRRPGFRVEAKGFSHSGDGNCPDAAVQSFLVRNGLESRK